jgi:hypothetical protein
MKMHDREWYGIICRPRIPAKKGERTTGIIRRLTKPRLVTWREQSIEFKDVQIDRIEVSSSRRYFLLPGSDTLLDDFLSEPDTPRLIRRGRTIRFGYVGYVASMSVPGLRGAELVLLPYAGLVREFWLEMILRENPTELAFIRCDIKRLQALLLEHHEATTNIQLRLGRALIHNDPNANVVTLRGQNVLDSTIYRILFGKHGSGLELSFDDTYSRVAYFPTDALAATIFLDRYGNFRCRPGKVGGKAVTLLRFLKQLAQLELLQFTMSFPILRFNVDDEQE